MLSSVSTLLLCLMVYCFVVYRNGIGVMNIQFAEGYKNAEMGEKERGFCAVGAGARERKDNWSWGSREGVGAVGPNSEDAVGAGARERKDIWSRGSREGVGAGGAELGRWSRSRGPREDRCSKEYEHEEEEGLKRT